MGSLARRTVLRGAGAAVALPWLEAMAAARVRQVGPISRRLVTVYLPNGMAMDAWTPATEGTGFAWPTTLTSLAPFSSRLRLLSGLSTLGLPAVPAYHAGAATKFLTATSPHGARGTAPRAGISVDQVAARYLGDDTQVASLELALEPSEIVGACDVQYSCAYQNTICWASPTAPLPMESSPAAVFERLYGDSAAASPEDRRRALSDDRSLLDSVRESLGRVRRVVGAADRARLDEYADSIRSVERRVRAAERRGTVDVPDASALAGVPGSFREHGELMVDLMVLALQANFTRVCTLMTGREASTRSYVELGVPEAHHEVSHHQNDPERLRRLARINQHHLALVAYLLERLKSAVESERSLLDDTTVLVGAGMSDSNLHRHDNLPILVAGPAALTGGRHTRVAAGTPLANLHLTLLDALGARIERFGNSTGTV